MFKSYEPYVEELIVEARKSKMAHKHGAGIFSNGKLIAKGHNAYKNDKYSIHAEVSAINNLKKNCRQKFNTKSITMVVIRVNGQDDLRLSKPCENCSNIIKRNNIKLVYYS